MDGLPSLIAHARVAFASSKATSCGEYASYVRWRLNQTFENVLNVSTSHGRVPGERS